MARRQRRDLAVFESSCHLPTCVPHTVEASHCAFNADRHAESCEHQFLVFGLTQPRIEPESTISAAHARFTRPLIVLLHMQMIV